MVLSFEIYRTRGFRSKLGDARTSETSVQEILRRAPTVPGLFVFCANVYRHCVRACVRACVRVCVYVHDDIDSI